MNQYPTRMSPWTAFFIGAFGFGGVLVLAITAISIHGLNVVDARVSDVVGFARGTIDELPAILKDLPPAVGDMLNDERRPDYASELDVTATLMSHDGRVRPVITIRNNGTEVVSMLAIRVAAIDEQGRPRGEWTDVVATPLAIDRNWRGPMMPGATRHVVESSSRRWVGAGDGATLSAVVEIVDVRVWNPRDSRVEQVRVANR